MGLDFLNFLKRTNKTAPIESHPSKSALKLEFVSEMDDKERVLVENVKDATILVVDDNRELLRYLKEAMGEYVKETVVAGNAFEAIERLTTRHIDVIISDIMMPGLDGFELCRYIKNNIVISHIPVILLTARIDAESRNLGYKNGADAYLTKPFSEEELVSTMDTLLKKCFEKKKQIAETLKIDGESTISGVDEEILKQFHNIVEENIKDPEFGVQKVEELMNMNHSVLFNKIVQLTGLNIISYINRVRLERAITLMKNTEMSMAEIAEDSGFSNQRYFSTSFKNYTGQTPLKYKKKFQKRESSN